ncbi:MAG TPA: flavin reductase family protein [Candidatus Saccharimonadales bacterium]|nr:flavin reductase family protein [Candidatus Saccharimonadales bacterium]
MVDRELYRAIAGAFPTGVTVVTTLDPDGRPRGLTSQAFIALSTEPPLMLVSVDRASRTLAALKETRSFVINFLKSGAEEVSTLFASKSDDKFKDLPWVPSGLANGAPILRDHIVAFAECLVEEVHEVGDHFMFIGRVIGGQSSDGVPLMYYRRTYAAWPAESPAPKEL